jgi:chemotaxis protein CheD
MGSVRMGEMEISSVAGDTLAAIGLGSCIGLAFIDHSAGVAGLAHVVLPDSQGAAGPPAKFADLAVPELLGALERLGAQRLRIQVAIVGGAKMFAIGSGLDVGARNNAAVREALKRHQLRLGAEATGGNRGRTMNLHVGTGTIKVHEAGEKPRVLLAPGSDRLRYRLDAAARLRTAQLPS